jgi:hypothetical protein
MDLITAINEITKSSNILISWSISILGGTILAIFSTSYLKLENKWGKLSYLLFIPGWYKLIVSIRTGNIISRRQIMAYINPENQVEIINKMNDDYIIQLDSFNCSMIFIGIWLTLFMLFWTFQSFFKPNSNVS